MKQVLSFLLTPIFFFFFGLTLGIFHIIQLITLNLFGHKWHDKSVVWLNFWLTKCLHILGTRIHFKGFDQVLKDDHPKLFISNHQSMWDISPVIWKLGKWRIKYIAKASLAKFIPSISYNLRRGGSLAIDRSDREGSVEKIKKFAQFIKEKNFSICIYPEGTRSRQGEVKPFKTAGIEAILKVIPDIQVVPIAIKNTGKIDNSGKFNKNIGVKAVFTMLPGRKLNLEHLSDELESIRQEIMVHV
jgi:1-acyl-sn-glycerol-3-phosphate acyltransferase